MKKQTRGRPKLENPKSERISVRSTITDKEFILKYFGTMQNFFDVQLLSEKEFRSRAAK